MHLLMALINSTAIACATGLILLFPLGNAHVTIIAMVVHIVSGVLALILFVPFLFTHLRDGKEPLRNLLMPWRMRHRIYREETPVHRLIGYGLTLASLGVFISGLVIAAPSITYLSGQTVLLPLGMSAILLRAHQGFTVLFFLFFGLHLWKRAKS
jgi:hypothetical protein